jgi:uncharacterized protein
MIDFDPLRQMAHEQPYPLLFVTVSGAHLYGFPSADSDVDLRGVHLLPLREVVGLRQGAQTIEAASLREGREVDLVTHEVVKFFRLLLKPNGYVLEQLYSPLVVHTSSVHEELREIAAGCITRRHARHYLGFARTQWNLFTATRRVKPLLYLYRVLLTGIHLMETGQVEANLITLNARYTLPWIRELVDRKVHGREAETLEDADIDVHIREYARLANALEETAARSTLPEVPSAWDALNDLLTRMRLPSDSVLFAGTGQVYE